MRKTPFRIGVVLAGLVLLAAAAALVYLDRLATAAVNRMLAGALRVPASVASVRIGLLSGRVDVTGLRIANPPGFPSPEFLTLRRASAKVSLASLTAETIVVESIRTEGLVVRKEWSGFRDNISGIFPPSRPGGKAKEKGGQRLKVRTILLEDTTVSLSLPGRQQEARVDRLVIDDPMGRRGGALLQDIVSQVVSRSIEAAVADVGSSVGDGAKRTGETGKSAIEGLRSLFR